MFKRHSYLVFVIFFTLHGFAQNSETNLTKKDDKASMKSSLSFPQGEKALINEIIVIKPVEGHVLNLEAPNTCSKGRIISKNESEIKCQTSPGGENIFDIYVCDEKKTYCKTEKHKVITENPSGFWNWFKYYWRKNLNRTFWKAPKKTGISHNTSARGFIHNDINKAITLSRSQKKPILLFYTQLSCPPCRLIKEMTLESDLFQEISKDYIRLQVDSDVDVDPNRIGPLKIPSTPTFVLLNPDFKEFDRFTQVQSPLAFRRWLDKARSYKEPVKELVDKKNLSSKEKERLSLWYFIQWKTPEAKKFIGEKSTSWVKDAIDMEKSPTLKKINAYLGDLKSKGFLCGDEALSVPMNFFWTLFKETKSPSQAFSLFEKYESIILAQKEKDPLGCAYLLNYIYGYGKYMIEKTLLENKKEFFKKKTLQNAMNFPSLPGVKKKTQLEYTISKLKEDKKETQKLLGKMRSENKNDYTYDYWETSTASYDKDYEKALKKINKALEIAKDRDWQKALSLKIDILMEMDKKKEAQKIIKETLAKIDLPYSPFPKIHSFVQELRELQVAALEDTDKTKSKK